MVDLPPSWRDHRDEPVDRPPPPGPAAPAFYRAIGDFQGATYRRNAFAQATADEARALARHLDVAGGERLLDVGCGDGRHLRALARTHGTTGIGVDVSPALVAAGTAAARAEGVEGVDLRVGDARRLLEVVADAAGTFDGVTALCQGAFGTAPTSDPHVLAGIAAAVRPGGRVVVTAFSALFAARHLAPGDAFDPVHLVHHQVSEVRGPDDTRREFDLWTAAYTVRELVLLLDAVGLEVERVVGAEPGRYDATEIRLDDPELLAVARRR